jgi:hypothetical protein
MRCIIRARTSVRVEAAPRRRKDSESRKPTGDAAGEALRRELRRFSLCRQFVHQFKMLAQPPAAVPAGKNKKRRKGGRGARPLWQTVKPAKRKPGLAAAKQARTTVKARPGLAPLALQREWPEAMQRELFHCRTEEQRRLWASRWAEILSGRAAERDRAPAAPARPARPAACRRHRLAI